MRIGDQLKKLRELKKTSLTELAKISGVQIATLSRIENNKMTGTLDCHLAISKALGIDITELYQSAEQEIPASIAEHPSCEQPKPIKEGKFSKEILARHITSKRMLPELIKIDPKGNTEIESLPAGAERFLYVLEGTVDVKFKSQTVQLQTKSSLYFNATQAHSLENTGDKMTKVLSVTTPVII